MKSYFIALFIALISLSPVHAEENSIPAGTYSLDKSHASLIFSVSHIGFSHYTMSFNDFNATLEIDPKAPEKASVKASIDPGSLDLPSPPEGFTNTILGTDWLNVSKFPSITFT